MKNKKILIAGTGGFAKEVLCLIDDLGLLDQVEAFIEPDFIFENYSKPLIIHGIPVKPYSYLKPKKHLVTVAIGESRIREKVVKEQLPDNTNYLTLIHPTAVISKWNQIGEGAIICAGTIITCDVTIGKFAQVNLQTTIGHDCVIGDYFTTAPNVNISGNCTIHNHVYFGTASVIKQGLSIAKKTTIGMGAIVTKCIEDEGHTFVGNPAKILLKKENTSSLNSQLKIS
jgi:sugar O-acyltransferase (sialic acid O-acetyltransferase NeuD family)